MLQKIIPINALKKINDFDPLWLPILFLFAFFLRFYNLGKSSFWLDEVGVANIIKTPDLLQMLVQVKAHAMAMPLDYVVGWLAARVCTTDACLRFPSVLWGTLTIPVFYLLIKELSNEKTALTASLFLTLSSLHIYYAQELRYYEAMLFFSILVMLTFLRANKTPSPKRWGLFILVAVLGEYTHIYVTLSLSFCFFILLLTSRKDGQQRAKWVGFIVSALVIGLLLLPGYLIYSESNQYPEPFNIGRAVISLLMGSGWLPFQEPSRGLGLLWGGIYTILVMYGIFLVFRHRQRVWLAWMLSGVLNSALILAADAKWGYWIVPRQFIQLLPLSCGLWAVALVEIWDQLITKRFHLPVQRRTAAFILAAVLVLGSIPNLQLYYENRKGLSREISTVLEKNWQPGSQVMVIPQEYPVTYNYYLLKDGRQDISAATRILELEDLPSLGSLSANTFLITPRDYTLENRPNLLALGFQPVSVEGEGRETNLPYLWVKK